ncbi:SLATT domain-containing protein [Bacillus subtilis]|nr:SLATT domain-containing protein [Bacillus sp. SXabc123]
MEELDKESFLKELAEHGYNIGFGAKKHFATYDMVSKIPGIISLVGLLIGVGQLAYPHYKYSTTISTILIMVSIVALTMSSYNSEKEEYNKIGTKLTTLFNELKSMYYKVKNSNKDTFTEEVERMREITNEYYEISKSNQIFGSDWWAHYKFFWQHQIEWIDEQKNFKLWKDKIPKSFLVFLIVMALVIWGWYWVFIRGGSAC